MVRTPCCDKNGLKKGTWTAEEDQKLADYVSTYGCWNWRKLPKYAGLSRCGKSCRLRWMNYLRPNIKRGNYTQEEDEIILKLHRQLGNKWSAIATQLPGRTDNEIKNHWHTSLKKIEEQEQPPKKKLRSSLANRAKRPRKQEAINPSTPSSSSAHEILESSQWSLSSSSPSSISLHSLVSENSSTSDASCATLEPSPGQNHPPMILGQEDESFWGEPFFGENIFASDDDFLVPSLVNHGPTSHLSHTYNDEFSCSYDFVQELVNELNW